MWRFADEHNRAVVEDMPDGGVRSCLASALTEQELASVAPFAPPPLTTDDYATAIQALIDAVAKDKGYLNGFAMASYATDPEHSFEVQPFVVWRGQVWKYAYAELAKVQGGLRPQPTIQELLQELPRSSASLGL